MFDLKYSYHHSLLVMYNFTWVSTREPAGDWGVVPKSGPANPSGVWGGVVGGVKNETYQMSVSAWYIKYGRSTFLSFAQMYPSGAMNV